MRNYRCHPDQVGHTCQSSDANHINHAHSNNKGSKSSSGKEQVDKNTVISNSHERIKLTIRTLTEHYDEEQQTQIPTEGLQPIKALHKYKACAI
jgi:hypothetical protein